MSTDFEQQDEYDRVRRSIGPTILDFCRRRWNDGEIRFHMEELRQYVVDNTTAAPDSASRILRGLRQEGYLHYSVPARSDSLYQLDWVHTGDDALRPRCNSEESVAINGRYYFVDTYGPTARGPFNSVDERLHHADVYCNALNRPMEALFIDVDSSGVMTVSRRTL